MVSQTWFMNEELLIHLAEIAAILHIKISQFNDYKMTLEINHFIISMRYLALHQGFKHKTIRL